ncbi:MAG: hypothetical protein NTX03_09775, partial [Bacteroidetes bacterium]|nr:hypothetical protein [Bacteroidota bacterium]
MKKLFFVMMMLVTIMLSAQTVPNGNFEIWSSTQYDALTGWRTSNSESIPSYGVVTVTKSADSKSGSALKMQTYIYAGDTQIAYVTISDGDPGRGVGGMPYSAKPTNITGYYKYDLKGQDTALFLVYFKKNGKLISKDLFKIRGTGSQSSWTSFSFTLSSLSTTPDTVIIAASPSNAFTNNGVSNGSTLYLDELVFTGTGTMPSIPNGNFDTWTSESLDIAQGWTVDGGRNKINKTTDKYKGSYAMRLETISEGSKLRNSSISSGRRTNNGPRGGRPFTNMKDTLVGYYKYDNLGSGDTAQIQIGISKNSSQVGWFSAELTVKSSYTYFEIPINASSTPDSLLVEITSSKYPMTNAKEGSTLIVDEIHLKSEPLITGIAKSVNKIPIFVYPNPATNKIIFDGAGQLQKEAALSIYNNMGQLIT